MFIGFLQVLIETTCASISNTGKNQSTAQRWLARFGPINAKCRGLALTAQEVVFILLDQQLFDIF